MTTTTTVLLRRHCHFPIGVLTVQSFGPGYASALHASRITVTAISVLHLPRLLAKRAVGCSGSMS